MREETAKADRLVAEIAARQHGVVSTEQLRSCGVEKSAVSRRVKRGRLHRVHRGVYAVGHRGLSVEGRWMAAVLACGKGAVLSHGAAAALWGLLRPLEGQIDVSVPTTAGVSKRRGIHVHRRIGLSTSSRYPRTSRQSTSVTVRKGIPVTTVPRTIEDLRGAVSPRLVRRAIRQAEFIGLRLDGIETDHTRSDLEQEFLLLCSRNGLLPPEVNAKAGRLEVDFLWRAQHLVVETDSFTYHRGSVAFQDDHARDLELRASGFAVHRFTERQLEAEPGRVIADVARALAGERFIR